MTARIIGMLAETYVHAGSSGSSGAIDLPVERERTTQWPVIFGSGTKGALRSWAEEVAGIAKTERDKLFGKTDDAGTLLVSDARLLLLPVRSLNSSYVWLTCPLLLGRLGRDMERAGMTNHPFGQSIALTHHEYRGDDRGMLTLEERSFTRANPGDVPHGIATAIEKLIAPSMRARVAGQIAIVSDKAFGWFAQFALPVAARNQLERGTKQSQNLWYEETLPPDTVMYLLLADRAGQSGAVSDIEAQIRAHPYCRFGGNETIGQGWFRLAAYDNTQSASPLAGGGNA